MARTYIENEYVKHKLSEDDVRERLGRREAVLRGEIKNHRDEYISLLQYSREDKENERNGMPGSSYFTRDEMHKQQRNAEQQKAQDVDDIVQLGAEKRLLQKYGQSFADLYYIKEQHEILGGSEKVRFAETDITGNGDILTEAQHYYMSSNGGRISQPVLVVEDGDISFNIGMMEFDKPNSAPEVKAQISFNEDSAEDIDAEKMYKILEFCERYGISASDMTLRRFDGSLDESEIQAKMELILDDVKNKIAGEKAEAETKAAEGETKDREPQKEQLIERINEVLRANGLAPLTRDELREHGLETAEQISDYLLNEKYKDTHDVAFMADLLEQSGLYGMSEDLPKGDFTAGNSVVANANTEDVARGGASASDNFAVTERAEGANTVADAAADRQSNGQEASSLLGTALQKAQSAGQKIKAAGAAGTGKIKKVVSAVLNSKQREAERKAEKQFEEFLQNGLGKKSEASYFKRRVWNNWKLWQGSWTEYVVYDNENPDNLRKDGVRDKKTGAVKYNYMFKLFIRTDRDGNLHFSYRTPNNKPMSEDIIGGLAGQLKSLGNTHVRFPSGLTDKEKGMWRKALAEKGLIPVGISLDRAKASGMIKAAKEKLSNEEFARFKYRLAKQMNKNNKEKGKKVDKSEQDFIDGLLLAHKYEAFANGYGETVKDKITGILFRNPNSDAADKIAAMATLRRMFDVFKLGVEAGSILNINENGMPAEKRLLTDRELAFIKSTPALAGNPSEFSGAQFAALFDMMMERGKGTARAELDKAFHEPGARRADEAIKQGVFKAAYESCKSVVKELRALGVDEIELPESTTDLPYNAPVRNNQKPAQTQTQTHTHANPGQGGRIVLPLRSSERQFN